MIDDKSFGGKVGVVGSGRSIYVISLFLLNVGFARSMGSEQYGSFLQVFMFTALFMILSMGIPETIYFFLPRLTDEERPRFLGQTMLLLGISGCATALILWFGAPVIAEIQGNPDIVYNLRLFGIYGAFLVCTVFVDPIFITYKRIKNLFILSALHGAFFMMLTVWQFFFGAPARMMFYAMAVFGVFKFVLALYMIYKMRSEIGSIRFFGGKSTLLLQLSYALPVALSKSIDIMSTWLDKFVVSIFFGHEVLGYFYVGAIEIPLIGVLLSSVYSIASPILNKLHHENKIDGFVAFVNKTLKFTSKIIWPLFLYLMIYADHIIPLVFKSDFEASVAPFRIYLIMMPVRIALYGVIVLALGKPKIVFFGAFGTLLLNLVLNLVLVHRIGFLGPAIATVITTYLHVIFLGTCILLITRVSVRELIPFRDFLYIGLSCILAALISFLMTRMVGNDLSAVISSLIIFFGAYIIIGTKAGFLSFPSLMDIARGDFVVKKDDSSKDR